jgi:hypothetical protein
MYYTELPHFGQEKVMEVSSFKFRFDSVSSVMMPTTVRFGQARHIM